MSGGNDHTQKHSDGDRAGGGVVARITMSLSDFCLSPLIAKPSLPEGFFFFLLTALQPSEPFFYPELRVGENREGGGGINFTQGITAVKRGHISFSLFSFIFIRLFGQVFLVFVY